MPPPLSERRHSVSYPKIARISGLSRFLTERYEDIHECFTETVVFRCWRFDRLYVECEAEEFTGATLVIRKWMQDIVSGDEFQSIKNEVRAFAESRPGQWDLINGLCSDHRNKIVTKPTFENTLAYNYFRFQELQEFGANILVVEGVFETEATGQVKIGMGSLCFLLPQLQRDSQLRTWRADRAFGRRLGE